MWKGPCDQGHGDPSLALKLKPPFGFVSAFLSRPVDVDSVPIATYGPVSPTVSFQPLPRIAARTNLSPGVTVSALSAKTTLSSSSTGSAFAKGAGDQAKAATCVSTKEGVPTNSVTTSSVPSIKPVPVNTMSSKLPISTKSTAATPSTGDFGGWVSWTGLGKLGLSWKPLSGMVWPAANAEGSETVVGILGDCNGSREWSEAPGGR